MTDKDIIWLIGISFGFLAGYSLGHLRGQCVGIKWCQDLDNQIAPIRAALSRRPQVTREVGQDG